MSDFIIAPAADLDLERIWDYIAIENQNPDAADRVRDEIFESFKKLAANPGIGHRRSDLVSEPLRFWLVRNYLVIYRTKNCPIEIVRVLHAARDVQVILGDKPAHRKPRRS